MSFGNTGNQAVKAKAAELVSHSALSEVIEGASEQPGEIVALPLGADRPLDVYVGNVRKLSGRLAAEQGRLMVMVQERLNAEAIHEGI